MSVPAVIFGAERGPRSEMDQRLPEVLDFYVQYHHIEGHTEATQLHYLRQVRQFILWLQDQGHSLEMVDITSFHILGHLEDLKRRGRKPRTVKTRLQALKTMFDWAVDWDIMEANPASRIKAPKVPKTRKGLLKSEHFAKLLELCPLNTFLGARRASILSLLATTGIRRRELTLLTVDDLDWKRGQLRVFHGKGQKERQVPFLTEVQRPMLRYIKQRTDDLRCLWVSEERLPLSYHGIEQDLDRLFVKAGIRGEAKDTCHIFRRTFAANAVWQGIVRPYIQAIAGWSTPQMFDDYVRAMEAEDGAIEAFRDFKPFGG